MEQKINVVEMLAENLLAASAQASKVSPGMGAIAGAIGGVYDKAARASKRGDPVAWVSFSVPTEILWAMDIVPICDVGLNALIRFPGLTEKYLDLAHEFLPEYLCSTNKVPAGLLLSGDAPIPDMLIAQNNPCDSILGVDSAISRHVGIPYFGIGTPYINCETGYQYVAEELKRLVAWLEEQTGRTMEPERLKQAAEYSNQASQLVRKINALVAEKPCPFPLPASGQLHSLFQHLPGTPELVDCLKTVHEELQYRVDNRISPLPFEEKLRLVWIYVMVGHNIPDVYDAVTKEYGAVHIINMCTNITIPPAEDFSNDDAVMLWLAEKCCNLPMTRECGGPWEDWVNNAIDMVRFYKADGAVFAGHAACKSSWAVAKLAKDRLLEETGIPMVCIELDAVDPRVASGEAIRNQMTDFTELILDKRGCRA